MEPGLYEAVVERSGGRCEAEFEFCCKWHRCPDQATELHHMLPKSRGGRHLDNFFETYHLIHLCKSDHIQAHSRKDAAGLMIDGSVTWDKMSRRPVYTGPDKYLTSKYSPTSG